MYFTINVAKKVGVNSDYRHLFATAPHSITNRDELKKVLSDLLPKFPAPDYHVAIHFNPESGSMWEIEKGDMDVQKIVDHIGETMYK